MRLPPPAMRRIARDVVQVCPVDPLLAATQSCYAINVLTGSVLPMSDSVDAYMIDSQVQRRRPPAFMVAPAAAAAWVNVGYVLSDAAAGARHHGSPGPKSMNLFARRSAQRRERYDYRVQDATTAVFVEAPPLNRKPLYTGDELHVPGYGRYVVTLYAEFENGIY